MRGLRQEHSARVVIAGHAFVQNVRRGHYELAEEPVKRQLAVTFEELAQLVGIVTRRDLLRLIARQAAPDAATSQRLRPTPP